MLATAEVNVGFLLRRTAEEVNRSLTKLLAQYRGASPRLAEAMRYSIEAGGKRLRPALVLWCCELCGGDKQAAMPPALAVECVHTFSLIHDDLPALDDDDFRRGRPTSHRAFGEAMAILAGDGLLALAFEILARPAPDANLAAAMLAELSRAAGWEGMIGGEAADLEGESAPPDRALVERIHAAKTARLIEASCRLGAMAARASESRISALAAFGRALGLAFQAADDLLDLTGSPETIGKPTGKDSSSGKQTYLRLVGLDEARRIAEAAAEQAVAALDPFAPHAARLAALARYAVDRKS